MVCVCVCVHAQERVFVCCIGLYPYYTAHVLYRLFDAKLILTVTLSSVVFMRKEECNFLVTAYSPSANDPLYT